MKNKEKSVLRRVAAVTMIVMMTMALGIAVYADAEAPITVDESEIAAFGPLDESTVVAIGAEAEENTVAIGAENQSNSTSSGQKDSVPKTGEADYTMVLLPMILFGIAGMVVFGKQSRLYETV